MRTLIIISFLFTCAISKAQVNYVLNPDFEVYTQCPTGPDNINNSTYWSAVDSVNTGTCVPEYCNPCATGSGLSVPISGRYYQQAHSGEGFAHVQVYYNGPATQGWLRDYLQGRLYTPLQIGKSYCVQFYTCIAEHSNFAIDKIGAYLDDGSIDTISYCGVPLVEYNPQIQNNIGILEDTSIWIKIEQSFVATGGERFITIGNFYDYYNTDATLLPLNSFNNNTDYSWYLIDDVSVIESDLPAFAGGDTWVVEGDSVFIGRTPEVGLDCKWLVNGSVIDSGAGIWVHPTVTTTYVLEQTICGLVKTDTVTIEVWAASVNGITNGQQINLYPNPATNQLMVQQDKIIFTTAVITNQLGQIILSEKLSGKVTKLDIEALPDGVYNIMLEGDKGKEVRRFVKM